MSDEFKNDESIYRIMILNRSIWKNDDDDDDEIEGLNIVLDDGSGSKMTKSKNTGISSIAIPVMRKKVEHALRQRIDSMGMQDADL